jgi:GNAT superfamily N-acetyltransferase
MARHLAEVWRVGVDDLEEVLLLWSLARPDLTQNGRPLPPAEQVRPRLAASLASGELEVLLARWEGRSAGFAVLGRPPASALSGTSTLTIEHLYVIADLRRHGIARALLNGVVLYAERCGVEQVATSVPPWSRETHRFFARLGFSPVVVRRVASTGTLRRKLAGPAGRGSLEELLSRRRSLRGRTRSFRSSPLLSSPLRSSRVLEPAEGADPARDDGPPTGELLLDGMPHPA